LRSDPGANRGRNRAVQAAASKSAQKFFVIDWSTIPFDNVWNQFYATDQPAFLAGYLAAAATKTGKVATFGGIQYPVVTIYMDGFALGVEYYNQKHGTRVEVLGWE
jgi:basic membrane protein A